MPEDRIERDIVIAALPERVWAALTEAAMVSVWLGRGKPAEVDLRPGGRMVVDHGEHGSLLARFVRVEEPADGSATLVEFALHPEDGGTRLTVTESGFAALTLPLAARHRRYQENTLNWPRTLASLRGQIESPA